MEKFKIGDKVRFKDPINSPLNYIVQIITAPDERGDFTGLVLECDYPQATYQKGKTSNFFNAEDYDLYLDAYDKLFIALNKLEHHGNV